MVHACWVPILTLAHVAFIGSESLDTPRAPPVRQNAVALFSAHCLGLKYRRVVSICSSERWLVGHLMSSVALGPRCSVLDVTAPSPLCLCVFWAVLAIKQPGQGHSLCADLRSQALSLGSGDQPMSHLTCLGMSSPSAQGPLWLTLCPKADLSKSVSNEMLLAWQEGAWDPMDRAMELLLS